MHNMDFTIQTVLALPGSPCNSLDVREMENVGTPDS
jgi:hypothetical protein